MWGAISEGYIHMCEFIHVCVLCSGTDLEDHGVTSGNGTYYGDHRELCVCVIFH